MVVGQELLLFALKVKNIKVDSATHHATEATMLMGQYAGELAKQESMIVEPFVSMELNSAQMKSRRLLKML
jgi:hypothetical protein